MYEQQQTVLKACVHLAADLTSKHIVYMQF